MMQEYLLIAAAAAAIGAGGMYRIEEWRIDAKELEHAEQKLADERSSAAATLRRIEAVSAAQSDAATRLVQLRTDAANSLTELDGLRTQSAYALRSASTNLDTCNKSATTCNQLFIDSAGKYQSLAEVCDRHVSDIKTLTQAWPK